MNVAAVFMEILRAAGVRYLFGNPGTTELPLMDALVEDTRIRYILGLLLIRRKVLKFVDVERSGDDELLVLRAPATGDEYRVTNPRLCDEELAAVQAEVVSAATPDVLSKKPMAIMRRRTAARDLEVARPGNIPRVERAVRVSVSPQGHKDVRSRSPRRHVVRS